MLPLSTCRGLRVNLKIRGGGGAGDALKGQDTKSIRNEILVEGGAEILIEGPLGLHCGDAPEHIDCI